MNTSITKQRRLACSLVTAGALFALVSTNAPARDTDIYFTDPSASGLKPNVLLVLDTSGSMNENVSNGMSRIDHMKKAMKAIIDESTNINLGVMRFSRGEGAAVIYPLSDLDADVPDDGNLIAAMQNSSDDAEQASSGTVTTTSSTLDFQSGNTVGIRFLNVYIPKGAAITSAYLTFVASGSDSSTANMSISADNDGNAPIYTTAASNITGRTQTTAVAWNSVPSWSSGTRYYSTDISTVVKAIVDGPNWQSGNAIAFTLATSAGTRRAYSYDDGNYSGRAPKLVVKYDSSGVSTVVTCNKTAVARVTLGTDDAEERANGTGIGGMTTAQTGSNPIQLTKQGTSNEQIVGLRFQNIQVPKDAVIVSSELEFRIRSTNSAAASLTIYGQAIDDAPTFTGTNFNISSRTKTTTFVDWNNLPNPSAGAALTTPDIKDIVSQIVSRPGWTIGNDMVFIIQAQGAASGPRNVEAYETAPGKAPYLRITYQGSCATRKARDEMKAAIVAMTAGGNTPIVDSLYEAALYFRGNAVDYGKVRENGTSGTDTHLLRVSHPLSYSGGSLSQPTGCTNADLEATACEGEQITGSPTYISPVTAGCQSNHIVLLTDGEATANNSATKVRTMTGASSCSGSGYESCGVTLTNYLANSDQFSAYTGTQPIYTHTVGMNISNQFLADLASNGKGTYHSTNDADELAGAFQEILNQVLSDPTGFVSPSLTVNAFNRLYDQDDVYFSVFSPQLAVGWPGNIKKYRLCDKGESCVFGEVLDANDDPAIDPNTSKIKATAQSFWSASADGPTVDQGGAGSQVPAYTTGSRKVYTYTGAADVPASAVDLTLAAHVVSQAAVGTPDNPALTKAMLGNTGMTDTQYYNIIRWMRGQDVQDDNDNGSTTDNRWKFADALHSRPATVTYGGTAANPVTKLFVGTNDGGLRMINTNTGVEEWIVYLPEFLPNMKNLMDNNSGEHIVGLDGASSIWIVDNDGDGVIEPANDDKVYLYVGMRRGGRDIYAFDVTPDSGPVTTPSATGEIKPKFLWRIKGGVTGNFAALGQTWSTPQIATIRVKCTSGDTSCDDGDSSTPDSKKKTVLIFGGGYDPSQDGVMPPGADAMGNGIYIVDPLDGSLVWRVGGTGSGAPLVIPEMKYAIASDVATVDSNGDGAEDRLYVGDTRGQVFRIDLSDQIDPAGSSTNAKNGGAPGSGGSNGFVFADVGCTGGVRTSATPALDNCGATAKYERRKFFYAPTIVKSRETTYSATEYYDLVTMASGDREDPLDKITKDLSIDPVHNRIYAFRDYNYQQGSPGSTSTLTDSDLYDSTSNALQDPSGAGYTAALADIKAKDGWRVDLKEATTPDWVGEKGLSRPTVFNGVMYVTTYIPPSGGPVALGTCPPPAEGNARLYGLNYLSGAGIVDLNGSGGIDRFVDIGGGIPSEVVVVSREGGTTAIVGTSGGASVGSSSGSGCTPPFCYPFPDNVSRIPTFWHDN